MIVLLAKVKVPSRSGLPNMPAGNGDSGGPMRNGKDQLIASTSGGSQETATKTVYAPSTGSAVSPFNSKCTGVSVAQQKANGCSVFATSQTPKTDAPD